MNALLASSAEIVTMSSREIAALTGKAHDNVRRDINNLAETLSLSLEEKVEASTGGRPSKVFLLEKRETLILVSGYSVELRARIIDRWQELEAAQAPALPAVPQTFAQALRLAAEQQDQIDQQQRAIEAARPKVAFADAVMNADGTTLVRDVAKTLGVGPIKLHKALKSKGVILPNNAPASQYVQKGYLCESTHTYETTDGRTKLAHATRVTGRGIEFIRRFCARHADLIAMPMQRKART